MTKTGKKWFDLLFESSYHPSLVEGWDKNELKEIAECKINEIVYRMRRNLLPNKLLKDLEEEIKNYMKYSKLANLFSFHFPISNEGNCVLFANVFVSSLEKIRRDILDNLKVKVSEDHLWIEYNDNDEIIPINPGSYSSKFSYPLESLVGVNFYEKGATLAKSEKYKDALLSFKEALKSFPEKERALCNIGIVHYLEGEYTKAIEYFDKALRINPEYSRAITWKQKTEKLIEIIYESSTLPNSRSY